MTDARASQAGSSSSPVPRRLVVHGAAGRMGRRIVACAAGEPAAWRIVGALEAAVHPRTGDDAGTLAGVPALGVAVGDSWSGDADVVIDFSLPGAVAAIAALSAERGIPLVVATTGLEPADQAAIRAAARRIAVLQAPSMSLAVNVAMDLVARAGALLQSTGERVDVEIVECHHRHKEDAPSGTALRFGSLVHEALGGGGVTHGREGRPGARPAGEIGYHAVRAGDNPGEHTILFGLDGESLAVNVRATSRDCYARGALAAAAFLVGRPAGLYSMADVLGLG